MLAGDERALVRRVFTPTDHDLCFVQTPEIIMNSGPKNPTIPTLSDGFSKARASALIASGVLVLVELEKIDLTKPIPLLGLSIPEAGIVKGVLCVVAGYNLFRMILEWFQSDANRRQRIPSRIDLTISSLLTLSAIVWSLCRPLDFRTLAQFPYIPSIALVVYGIRFGQMLGVWIWSSLFIRSREEALRLGLHRQPVAVRAVFAMVPRWIASSLLIVALSPSFSPPFAQVWIFLLLVPATITLFGVCFDLIRPSRRMPDGTVRTRKESLAALKRVFEKHDTDYQIGRWDEPAPFQHSELYEACESGNIERVKRLLDLGRPVNSRERMGWTPLMIAVANQHIEIAQLLLNKGANPNAANNVLRAPLNFAARYGREDIVRLLLSAGAEPGRSDDDSFDPPLIVAAEHGHERIVKILLDAGANPTLKDQRGITALDTAEKHGRGQIAFLLRGELNNKESIEKA